MVVIKCWNFLLLLRQAGTVFKELACLLTHVYKVYYHHNKNILLYIILNHFSLHIIRLHFPEASLNITFCRCPGPVIFLYKYFVFTASYSCVDYMPTDLELSDVDGRMCVLKLSILQRFFCSHILY